jgi:hypothetical protein
MVIWNRTLTGHLCSLFDNGTADPHKVGRADTDVIFNRDQAEDGAHFSDGITAKRFGANYTTQALAYLKNEQKNGFGAAERANGSNNMGIAERKLST